MSKIKQIELALCICTYRRPHLLELLLLDALKQTLHPDAIIIVDGDPSSEQVVARLQGISFPKQIMVRYVPSNQGNQTYQRFLAWKICKSLNVQKMLFLDDDLRIKQPDAIQNIVAPLNWRNKNIIAVTGTLDMGTQLANDNSDLTLSDLRSGLSHSSRLVSQLGTSSKYLPGDVTPAGNRIPVIDIGHPYVTVKWLRGGAIALRVDALSKNVLADDIFAMNHLRYGLCEDLIISRRLVPAGEILLALNSVFQHPSETPPVAYSSNAYHLGFATAFSRRWFNDNYRGFSRPKLSDRIALVKNFIAVFVLNVWRTVVSMKKQRFLFTYGYLRGIVYSIFNKPTAKTLTPHIDWWADAEEAISNQVVLQ